jgi:hypothetical protein
MDLLNVESAYQRYGQTSLPTISQISAKIEFYQCFIQDCLFWEKQMYRHDELSHILQGSLLLLDATINNTGLLLAILFPHIA